MEYSTIPTNIGLAKLRNASLLNQRVEITRVVFGDSGGDEYKPTGEEVALKNQVYETIPNSIVEAGESDTWIEIEAIIPHNVGGWVIREVGCYDADGDLIFIGNLPPSNKPSGEAGVIKDISFELVYDAQSADVVQIKIDPAYVIATRKYVDEENLKHLNADDPHPQYATDEDVMSAMQQADDDLASVISVTQFLPYSSERQYSVGETCYTKDDETGELSYWQWYSNVESLAGKDPLDPLNRHTGWTDNTKPFYWIPYTGDQVGMPFFWLDTTAPEWSVMEINVDLPVAVYWRLARRYPDLVSGGVINTGEIRGEFLRVLDQRRGVDVGRGLASSQLDQMQRIEGTVESGYNYRQGFTSADGVFSVEDSAAVASNTNSGYNGYKTLRFDSADSPGSRTGDETRPRNVARPMAIHI